MNIVIRCHDNFYKFGLTLLLHELFTQELNCPTLTFSEYRSDEIPTADVLILMFRPGEHYICHPEMRLVNPALTIGLMEKKHIPARGELPSCINNIVFIPQNADIAQIGRLIKHHWLSVCREKQTAMLRICGNCPHKSLTEQQFRMVSLLYAGLTSRQIACKMDIRQKTVLAHRNALMSKFRLRTDCELLQFLNAVDEKMLWPGLKCVEC